MDRPEHHSIDPLKERGVEKGRGRHSTFKAEHDMCSTRQILALFRGQAPGDCSETGWSAYGPLRALRCHLELKLKLKLRPERFSRTDVLVERAKPLHHTIRRLVSLASIRVLGTVGLVLHKWVLGRGTGNGKGVRPLTHPTRKTTDRSNTKSSSYLIYPVVWLTVGAPL